MSFTRREPVYPYQEPMTPPPPVRVCHDLTVTEIETLAKAGVKVDLDTINIVEKKYNNPFENGYIMQPMIDRLRRAYRNELVDRFEPFPLTHLSAVERSGKIHVFVLGYGDKPATFEDDAKLYPSDALMANIHLYIQTQPKRPRDGELAGAQQSAKPVGVYAKQPNFHDAIVNKFLLATNPPVSDEGEMM